MNQFVRIALLVCACFSFELFGATPQTLAEYKDIYEQELTKIRTNGSILVEADRRYIKALEALENNAKQIGNFPDTKAILDEKLRFESCKIIPEESPAGMLSGICDAQNSYRSTASLVMADRNARITRLAQLYVTALKKHITFLLQQNRMAEAEVVNSEIQQVELGLKKMRESQPVVIDAAPPVNSESTRGKTLPLFLRNGLILHYDFGKNNVKKGAIDLSPTDNNGEVHGATWIAGGKMGGSYEFDGQGDYIELGPSDTYRTQGQFSGCAWINRQSRSMILLSNYRGGTSYNGYFDFIPNDGAGNYYVGFGQGPDQMVRYLAAEKDIFPANEWHHVAFTYDERRRSGQKIKLYLDGAEIKEYIIQGEGNGGSIMQTSDQLRIMANRASGFGKGMIHDIMLFNRALSALEVKKIYDMR